MGKGLRFLTPTDPQETLALVVLCTVLIGLGGGAVKGLERITAGDPWNVRADHICLDAADEFLTVEGDPVAQLRARVEITAQALEELRDVGGEVPITATLRFQTMLSDKEKMVRLLKRQLHLQERDLPDASVEDRIESTFTSDYASDAEELDLYVCGQNNGWQ